MKPILFYINGLPVSSYFSLISLGMLVGLFFLYLQVKKRNYNIQLTLDIGLISISTAYIGARLFHVIFEMPSYYFENPIYVFNIWNGGFVYYGGILFPLIFLYLFSRIKNINFFIITDLLAIPVAIGTFVGRFACLLRGCCYGIKTNLPWGIMFPNSTPDPTPKGIHVHPTQIYMSLSSLIIFFILYYYNNKLSKKNGFATFVFLILYSAGRITIELFRDDFRGSMFGSYISISQFISFILILCSLIGIHFIFKSKTIR